MDEKETVAVATTGETEIPTVVKVDIEEKVDGRTVEGRVQSRLRALEEAQLKIQEILVEHADKIKFLSIRR